MWIARQCEATLRAMFRQFPAVVVTGARQAGKTALVRRVFPRADYMTLDLPSEAARLEQRPEDILRGRRGPLVIDEIQHAPSIFRHLKAFIDEDRRPGRFLLTGSQSFPLMEKVAESLAGRCAVLDVLNLSAAELQGAAARFDEERYLFRGGFPELHARPAVDSAYWFSAYLATYLERDVRKVVNVGSLRDFERFLRGAAARTGQILSYSDLARDVGIAVNTAKRWLSVLQASDQAYLLEPWFKNVGQRLVKSPKLYLCDTGLAAFLMGFESWKAVERSPAVGPLWETHVVMQAVRHFRARGEAVPLWYWRTAGGEEVDLLVERGGRFVAVECKYAESADRADLKGLAAFAAAYGAGSDVKSYVAARTRTPHPAGKDVICHPGSFISRVL